MQHSLLTAFLNGERPAGDFWREIEDEVDDCLAACAKHGSGRIIITDGPEALLTREQMTVFVAALAEGKLPLRGASYIADAIIMSHAFVFEDDDVGDVVHLLADDSAPVTQAELEGARCCQSKANRSPQDGARAVRAGA